jgi:hypothetical protein
MITLLNAILNIKRLCNIQIGNIRHWHMQDEMVDVPLQVWVHMVLYNCENFISSGRHVLCRFSQLTLSSSSAIVGVCYWYE